MFPKLLRLPRLPNPLLLRGGVDETQNPPKVEPDGRQRPEKEQSCGWGEAEDKNSLEFTDIAIVLVLILLNSIKMILLNSIRTRIPQNRPWLMQGWGGN